MRAVVQRVTEARVVVGGDTVGEIGAGLLLLVGISIGDDSADVSAMVDKVCHLRIFQDDEGRMNRSVLDTGGAILVVSQFTLLADVRRGRRPSFTGAASPREAEPLVQALWSAFEDIGISVATGVFGADMEIELINDGPVTIVIDVANGRAG